MQRGLSYKSLRRRHYWLVLGFGYIFLISSIFLLYSFFAWSKIANEANIGIQKLTGSPAAKVCICLADDRFSAADLGLASLTSNEEIQEYARDRFPDLEYWQMTAMINKVYALRFGYDVIMSDLSAYKHFFKDDDARPSVWLKPLFMLDMQYRRPDCTWFASIDSDAYFWMSTQSISLRDWFSTASLHEASSKYQEFERMKRHKGGFFPWEEQHSSFLMIGLNGIFSSPVEGFPSSYGDIQGDFLCAGVYFIKNTHKSKQFLHDWVFGPFDSSAEEKAAMAEYSHKFSLEQRILNLILYPRFKEQMSIYSFKDFGSKDGQMVRHIWSQFHQERNPILHRDLNRLDILDAVPE